MSFVGVGQILCVSFFPFWYLGWDVECDCIYLWVPQVDLDLLRQCQIWENAKT